jgi:hypothetical protein
METTPQSEKDPTRTDQAIGELERVAEEIRVRIHLATMDAKDTWSRTLEPKVLDARDKLRERRAGAREKVVELLDTLRKFAEQIP